MNMMTLLGIDIGKHSFHLHGQDAKGHKVIRYYARKSAAANCSAHWLSTGLHGGDGVVRRRPLVGPTNGCIGPRGEADRPATRKFIEAHNDLFGHLTIQATREGKAKKRR